MSFKKYLNFPIIDLHTHLRSDIFKHTQIAKESGIDAVVYMANSQPPLDNLAAIKKSLQIKRETIALPVSAITKNLVGKELVEVDEIKDFVVGFSDDGKCLKNLEMLVQILQKNVLVMAHLEPEPEMLKKYLKVLKNVGGKLHFQHISKKSSVDLLKKAKKQGLKFTAETCPHYFVYSRDLEDLEVNPPLGTSEDTQAIKQGLADGVIDCISSDYAPMPRKTGLAGFRNFVSNCFSLVLDSTLTKNQLKQKIYLNPLRILKNSAGAELQKQIQKLEIT
jgi:dihydroorotase